MRLEIRGGRNEDMMSNYWLAELPTRPYSGNLSDPGRCLNLTFDSEGIFCFPSFMNGLNVLSIYSAVRAFFSSINEGGSRPRNPSHFHNAS